MFLSTENPPRDPLSSSSSSNLLLRLHTSSDELGQSHLSNFSIRDYACSNRKNNIKNSWPFSTKSLQLFSTHGVNDPLPPFQKFSTLTNQFETTTSSSSRKQIVSHVHQTVAETSKGVCSQSRIIENGLFTSTSKSKVEIVVASTSNNKSTKKCGRGGGGMVKSKEDSCGGGLVTASESVMASKTCPICKTFSSASNTTLNAHIDQCLSVESAMPPVSSKPNKPRVEPVDSVMSPACSKPSKRRGKPQMKVKTLVDIYASARECTLEDLDKRNGTKWASVLSCTNRVAADKTEVSKKRKASPVGVGPVYIDAKGQKLRILTEFSEKKTSTATTPPLRKQDEDGSSEKKSSSQGSKENSKSSRKRRRGKKHGKYIKLTSYKANASEKAPDYQREFSGEGSSKGPRRIYNQRMLAKRGLVSKKINEKGHKLYALPDQSSEDDDDEWSGEERLVLRGADFSATGSSPLNKQKLRSQVSGRSKTMFESKRDDSRSVRVKMSEKEERSLAGAHLDTVQLKKSLSSIQEDKYQSGKNVKEVADTSPRASSMRNLSPPLVANGWRRLSRPVELKRARLDLSDEEETGKWESEMTQERELSDDDYVSGDNEVVNEVLRRSSPSFSAYYDYEEDDDEETSEEEEDNTKRPNVLDKTDDTGAEFYQSDVPSERPMYYSEEVGDVLYRQTACDEDVRFDSEVRGKRSLYVEVDTIPIPGPPGSFLPSPRGMGFDEHLGNSSVITSQFQSSMDQLDRNSSESPVSAVSNFAAGRLNFQTELSSSLDNPSPYSTTPMSFSVPSHHGTIAEAEPITADTIPSSYTNNDHDSCCCQRKDRISLNHQESHLLQRRTASSSITMNLTKSPTCLDPNHPFEQSPFMIQQEFDLHSKVSNKSVVPPSPSNSVLRLMGKNLMVMNQGEADNNNEEASPASLKPTPQVHDHQPCAGTGLYFNTGLYLSNSFESTHQHQTPTNNIRHQQTQTQASPFRDNFDHVRYFSPS